MGSFTVDGRQVQVSVQPSERARKTVEIEFRSKDELIVTLPYNKEVDVDALLERHRELVEEKYRTFLERRKILDGDVILYQGVPHRITTSTSENPAVEHVRVSQDAFFITGLGSENPSVFLKSWLRSRTEEQVKQQINLYKATLGEPSKVFITDTARWGFCRINGEIVFNWQLACLPVKLAEFVIIHELVHLSVMNHQTEFHVKMLKLVQDYRQRETELKNYISIAPRFELLNRL